MTFVSARVLTKERDGVSGYVNVTQDGAAIAIRITGEIIDSNLGSRIATVEITDGDLDHLPASAPGLEDTPKDPRYVAIMGLMLKRLKALHAEWVASVAAAPIEDAKPDALIKAMPVVTLQMLENA